ncbi:MAG TPA: heme-binding protein [Steroidobacteraceae bacterium]|nr:heme-binding protein [Steroidobacteraceae bacterium]
MKLQTVFISLLLAAPAFAQTASNSSAPAAPVPPARGPSLDAALQAARVAIDTCAAIDQKIGVSVVDSVGIVKVSLAADGASARGVQSSTNKAITALTFKAATSELGEKVKTDSALAEQVNANTNFNVRAGGVVLKAGNEVIGAIGVGGARGSEKDEQCALAAIAKVPALLK